MADPEWEALGEVAAAEGTNRSDIVRRLVLEYLIERGAILRRLS